MDPLETFVLGIIAGDCLKQPSWSQMEKKVFQCIQSAECLVKYPCLNEKKDWCMQKGTINGKNGLLAVIILVRTWSQWEVSLSRKSSIH